MDSRNVGKALGNALSGGRESVLYPCPDDNTMAAYLDGLLSPKEKLTFEEHASRCATCREVLGLALEVGSIDAVAPKPEPANTRPVLWWLRPPSAATAVAALLVIVGAILITVVTGPGGRTSAPQVSALRDAAEKTRPAAELQEARPEVARSEERAKVLPTEQPMAPRPPTVTGGARVQRGDSEAIRLAERQAPELAEDAAAVAQATPEPRAVVGGVATAASEFKGEGAAARKPRAEDEMHPAETLGSKAVGADQPRMTARAALTERAASPAQVVRLLTEQGPDRLQTRKVDGLLLYRIGDYWVDGRCAGQTDARFVEVDPDSVQLGEIFLELPGISELTRGGVQVLVRRNGDILVLPRGN